MVDGRSSIADSWCAADRQSAIGNRQWLWRLGGLFLVLLLACPALAVQRFGDVSFNVDPLPRGFSGTNQTKRGYLEYRVTLTNHSASRDHVVELVWPKQTYGGQGSSLRRVARRVLVAADSAVRVSILQPPLPLEGNGMSALIDGQPIPDMLNISSQEHIPRWGGHHGAGPALLASAKLGNDFWPRKDNVSGTDNNIFVSEVPIDQWSRQWLGYSRFDAVAVTADEWTTMPEEVRIALLRFAETGGVVVIDGEWDAPSHWRMYPLPTGEHSHARCFGTVLVTHREAPGKQIPAEFADYVFRDLGATLGLTNKIKTVEDANRAFPVIENLGIPVRGLFVLMLLFGIAIGPLNLIFISRRNRRIWLLWTVPLASFVTCGIVVVYAAVAEGWTGKARTSYITILDETTQRASTIGWAGYYAPITPASGFRFDYETELTPHIGTSYYRGRSRTVDWTTDQHLANGWIVARVPAHFLVRSSAGLQRLRMTFSASDGVLSATNGLGADIAELYVTDAEGRYHTASNVAAGQQVRLNAPATGPAMSVTPVLMRQKIFANQIWPSEIDEVVRHPRNYMQPNTYIAVLNTSPFVAEGLAGAERTDRTVVFGLAKEAIHAD